jgi:hypothetical protein
MKRFYRFVKAVARYSRKAPLQADVHALIVDRWSDQVADSIELDEIARKFAGLYETLLDYERTKGFPDPLIERTNIVKFYLELSIRGRGNDQHINRTMIEAWGKDWRTKLDKEILSSNT